MEMKNIKGNSVDFNNLKEGDVVLFFKKEVKEVYGREQECFVPDVAIYQGVSASASNVLSFESGDGAHNFSINMKLFKESICFKLGDDQHPPVIKKGLRYVFSM